ncbi:AAA family ATPase [Cohnella sp. CFH 77786]|uniref:AAA family ATPase n=1 Tax=Cohnella sp. CFH 77786 TaxID=2662265 RepID=UPI001C60BEB2|nr:AAA family ATPase [Cohnella sp. CFH 77786]MBW5447517.1 AAA family ATPase [Cohnella sp. CFH 77786]
MTQAHKLTDESSNGKRGELIVVCGAKGGIGKTAMVVNLAVALTKKNVKICLLDGDFQFGDIALALDLHSTFTIKDVVEDIDAMDRYALSGFLIHHNSGLKVLACPERPEYADLIKPNVIDRVCDLLLSQFDYVIVDSAGGLPEHTLQLIEKADQILMVTTLEMTAIKNTKLMLDTLQVLGYRDKIHLVINRATMESVIKASEVPEILGFETAFFIPNEFHLVSQSLNIGIPFVSNQGKSDLAKAVFKMAEMLVTRREISALKPKPNSFIQQIFRKTSKA